MRVLINSQIFSDFDNPRIAITIAKNIDNKQLLPDIQVLLAEITKQIQSQFKSEALSQHPKIAAWRTAHRQFGSKPKDYPSSIEALYKRILKGQPLRPINPVVDIYNYISLKYMLPIGGEDIDKIKGTLELTYAGTNETPVTVLGKSEAQAPAQGEVIYKDNTSTICRRWNWREVARTALSSETKNCILVIEALNPITDNELRQAQTELSDLVNKYCSKRVENYLLSATNSIYEPA
jgi:DNA/RNA-binding domain of Phe-tRNA-synthetase-like protein